MRYMFVGAESFNQDLSSWKINMNCNNEDFLIDSAMSKHNKLKLKAINTRLKNEDLDLKKGTRINREIVKEVIIDLQSRLRAELVLRKNSLKNTASIEQYKLLSDYKETINKFESRYPGISKDIKSSDDIER
jgi:hypothetical protein